ncbi:MAG: hypothetical protein LKE30_06690 [Bacteroidales bacterium]|jgi:hypothetical protein|nr:hypothetical protein [Bacteroidales bacterium]
MKKYFSYLLNAKNEYNIHSPFMFDFFVEGLKKTKIKKGNKKEKLIYSIVSFFQNTPIHIYSFEYNKIQSYLNDYLPNNKVCFHLINNEMDIYNDFSSIINNKESNNIILIFDDIYKNDSCVEQWTKILNENKILVCVDFYRIGVVFQNSCFKDKQNYILKRH